MKFMSYFYSTCKYLLNSEEHKRIFAMNKGSRNFVRKNANNIFLNALNKNCYNDNYINNYEKINNCIYANKNNNCFYKNYNGNVQLLNYFVDNDLYIFRNNVSNQGQNILYNRGNNLIGNIINEKNSPNNFGNLPKYDINLNIFTKNLVNQIDCPPFIPSNYPKKESEKLIRKKSDDSSSKDKESDSTSAISEKKDEEINQQKKKSLNKRKIEKQESEDYLVEMFGRRGWICILCNNFNYETRVKCNRCGIMKKPKNITEIRQKSDMERLKQGDWKCNHCNNLNYSFRKICNRCKIPKLVPLININNNNQFIKQTNLPLFKPPISLFCFNNKKMMLSNNL